VGRAVIVLKTPADRAKAVEWAQRSPDGTRITFQGVKRTLPQNDRMWAMVTDVSRQARHKGNFYSPDQWKVLFMHACGREVQFLPALDGSTFVPWGGHSSDLSKSEMSELIDFIAAWGAEHGVVFGDTPEEERAA
jgi:NinB protein